MHSSVSPYFPLVCSSIYSAALFDAGRLDPKVNGNNFPLMQSTPVSSLRDSHEPPPPVFSWMRRYQVLTLKQTGKVQKTLPVILFGKDYWQKIINWQVFRLPRNGNFEYRGPVLLSPFGEKEKGLCSSSTLLRVRGCFDSLAGIAVVCKQHAVN